MANMVISAVERNSVTKSDVKKARSEGKIPAVVYGKKVAGLRIYVDEKELNALLKHNAGGVVQMEVPNYGEQSVMVNEVQKDIMLGRIIHVDFHQIDLSEQVRATVRLELTGEAKGSAEGGILQQLTPSVEVRCKASDIPAVIEADVSHLGIGEHMFIRELTPPAGVEIKSDPDELIATVLVPQKELPETANAEREEFIQQDAEKADEVLER